MPKKLDETFISPDVLAILESRGMLEDKTSLPPTSIQEDIEYLRSAGTGMQRDPILTVPVRAVGAGAGDLLNDIGTLMRITGQTISDEGFTRGLTPTAQKVGKWAGDILDLMGQEGELLGEMTKHYWTENMDPSLEGGPQASFDWWLYNFTKMAVPFMATMGAAGAGAKVARAATSLARGGKAAGVARAIGLAEVGANRAIETAAGMVSAGLVGGGLEGANTYRQAIAMGKTPKQARDDALAMTFFTGALNAFAAGQFFKVGKAGLLKGLLRRAEAGTVEGITEALEEPIEAYILGTDIYGTIEKMAAVAPLAFIFGFLFSGSLALDKHSDFSRGKLELYDSMTKDLNDQQKFTLSIAKNAYARNDFMTVDMMMERLDASIENSQKHRAFLAKEAAKLTKAITYEGGAILDNQMERYQEAKAEQGARLEAFNKLEEAGVVTPELTAEAVEVREDLAPDAAKILELDIPEMTDVGVAEILSALKPGEITEEMDADAAASEVERGRQAALADVLGMEGTPQDKLSAILTEAIVTPLTLGANAEAVAMKNTVIDVLEEAEAETLVAEFKEKTDDIFEIYGVDPTRTVEEIEAEGVAEVATRAIPESVLEQKALPADQVGAEGRFVELTAEDEESMAETAARIESRLEEVEQQEEVRDEIRKYHESKQKAAPKATAKARAERAPIIEQAAQKNIERNDEIEHDPNSIVSVRAKQEHRAKFKPAVKISILDNIIRKDGASALEADWQKRKEAGKARDKMWDDMIAVKAHGKEKGIGQDLKPDKKLISHAYKNDAMWAELRGKVDAMMEALEYKSSPEVQVLDNKGKEDKADFNTVQKKLIDQLVLQSEMSVEDAKLAVAEMDKASAILMLEEFESAGDKLEQELEEEYSEVNNEDLDSIEGAEDQLIEDMPKEQAEATLDEIVEEEITDNMSVEQITDELIGEMKENLVLVNEDNVSETIESIISLSSSFIQRGFADTVEQFETVMDETFGGEGTFAEYLNDVEMLSMGGLTNIGLGSSANVWTTANNYTNKLLNEEGAVSFDANLSIKSLVDGLKADAHKIHGIGRKVYDSGANSFSSWVRGMKKVLGGAWNKFKAQMKSVWARITLPLNNERGAIDFTQFKKIGGDLKQAWKKRVEGEKLSKPDKLGKMSLLQKHAKTHIKEGGRNLAVWMREVQEIYTEDINPYLRPAWTAAVQEVNAEKVEERRAKRSGGSDKISAVKILAKDKNGNILTVPVNYVSDLDKMELFDTAADIDFLLNKMGEAITNPEYVFEQMDRVNSAGVWRKLLQRYGRAERMRKQELDIIFREIKIAFKDVNTQKLGVYSVLKDQQGEEGAENWVVSDMETVLRADGFGEVINEVKTWEDNPQQFAKELNAYKVMRRHFQRTLENLNVMREKIGKDLIRERFNYFTFVRVDEGLKAEGKTMLDATGLDINLMLKSVLAGGRPLTHAEEPAFNFMRRDPGAIKPLELDALKVFASYMDSAKTYEHFMPVAISVSALNGKWKVQKEGEKKLQTFELQRAAPKFSEYLDRWSNFILGAKDKREFGASNWNKFDKFLNNTAQNLATFTLGFSLRSIAIQPMANLFTSVYIGPNWVGKGMNAMLSGKAKWILHDQDEYHKERDRLLNIAKKEGAVSNERLLLIEHEALDKSHRSDHLPTRTPDVMLENIQSVGATGDYQKVKAAVTQWAFLGLQWTDMVTAEIGWIGAWEKFLDQGMNKKDAAMAADRVIRKTHAAAARGYRAPIQRTAIGKTLTIFQTFAIGEFNFVVHEVFKKEGLTNPDGTLIKDMTVLQKERHDRIMKLFIMSALVNLLYEDMLGFNSPIPSPMRNYAKRLNEDEGAAIGLVRALATEFIGQVPVIGGGVQFGSGLAGPIGRLYEDVSSIISGKRPADALKLMAKLNGVPATQLYKWDRNYDEGEDWFDIFTGAYQPSRFLWAQSIHRML